MEIAKLKRTGPKRIGELLVAANLVKSDTLLDALKESRDTQRQIGRVLMSRGLINEKHLDAAIEVQTFLREGLISYEFGVRALNLAFRSNLAMTSAFEELGWTPPQEVELPNHELADLLLAANVVSRKSVEEAFRQRRLNGMPLGRCLVAIRALTASMLSSALTARVLMRDGKINKDQAIAGLKAAHRQQQTLEQSLEQSGAFQDAIPNIKVGDLLASAGLVTEQEKVGAIELSLATDKPVGQIFLEQGSITQAVLEEGLLLQQMVQSEQITSDQATAILHDAHSRGVTVESILQELYAQYEEEERSKISVALLVDAGLVSAEDMEKAELVSNQMQATVGEVLVTNDVVPLDLINAASQAQGLIDQALIEREQAIAVLLHCHETGSDFHSSLESTPWEHIPAPPTARGAIITTAPPKSNGQSNPPGSDPATQQGWLGGLWTKKKKP